MYAWGYTPTVIQGPQGDPGPPDINSLKKDGHLSELLDKPQSLITLGAASQTDLETLELTVSNLQVAIETSLALKADQSDFDTLELTVANLDASTLKAANNLNDVTNADDSRSNISAAHDSEVIKYYNIDDYGAVPGGSDCSAAITAASAAATSNGTRLGYVKFGEPGSVYTVTSPASYYSFTFVEGNGNELVSAIPSGSYGSLVGVQTGNSTTVFNQGVTIQNLKISHAPNGKLFTIAQMQNCKFKNIDFDSMGDVNSQITIENTNKNVTFEDCKYFTRDTYIVRISGDSTEIGFKGVWANCNGQSFMFASGSGVKNISATKLELRQVGVYVAELYTVSNVEFDQYRITNTDNQLGDGELVSTNSSAVNIKMGLPMTSGVASPFINSSLIANGSNFYGPAGYNAVGTGASVASGGQIRAGRIYKDGGTALGSSDLSLSGWGSTATKSFSARDGGGTITITPNGVGIAANPTATLTFKDGTWGTTPVITVHYDRGGVIHTARLTAESATSFTFISDFTPVSGTAYRYTFTATGK